LRISGKQLLTVRQGYPGHEANGPERERFLDVEQATQPYWHIAAAIVAAKTNLAFQPADR